MPAVFKVSAKAVIISRKQVLLMRKPNGNWDLPGGRLEMGESLDDAVRRETREELGLPIEAGPVLHSGVRVKDEKPDVVVVTFLCHLNGDIEDAKLSNEHEDVRWFARKATADLTIDPVYREAIEAAYANGFTITPA